MCKTLEADITILGGLPVTMKYTVYPAEPDVGISSEYVEDFWITHVGNRKVKKDPKWLYARIDKKKGESERIIQTLTEYVDDYDY